MLLNPVVLAEQILSPPKRQGSVGKPCGSHVGEVNLNWIDSQITALIKTLASQAYIYATLETLPYSGALTSTSVNGFFSFQGETLTVCQNGS